MVHELGRMRPITNCLLPEPHAALRPIGILAVELPHARSGVVRTESYPLCLLRADILITRANHSHRVGISIDIASKAIGLVELELGGVTDAEGHLKGLVATSSLPATWNQFF